MRYSISNMMLLTAFVALAITPMTHLGIKLGIFALTLIFSTIVLFLRFLRDFNQNLTNLLWTVAIACVIIPLDLYFVFWILST